MPKMQGNQALVKQVVATLDENRTNFMDLMPVRDESHLQRLLTCFTNQFSARPEILACAKTPNGKASIVRAARTAAYWNVEPDGMNAHLVPYKGEVQFQFDYKGLIAVCKRSGAYKDIRAVIVRKGEFNHPDFHFDKHDANTIVHPYLPNLTGEDREVVFVYAVAEDQDGFKTAETMDTDQLEAVKGKSLAARKGTGPWITDKEEMDKKSVIKLLCKRLEKLPLDIRRAIVREELIERDITPVTVMDDVERKRKEIENKNDAPEDAQVVESPPPASSAVAAKPGAFGKMLSEYCKQNGTNFEDLSEKTGTPAPWTGRLLDGKEDAPDPDVAEMLLDAAGVPPIERQPFLDVAKGERA